MYMRTVTEPRGTLHSVCAPVGLRRPCAHTSDSRIPIRRHLSNPQKIVNTVTDYPATVHRHYRYRGACVWGAWARNVSIGRGTRRFRSQKRGEGYVRRVRITDPLPPKVVVHARDTWQHTYRYTEFPVPPATKKPSFRTSRTSRPHAIMQTRGGARKRVHDSGVQDGPAQAGDPAVGAQAELQANDEHRPDARAQTVEDESGASSEGRECGGTSARAQPISGIAPGDTHEDERPNTAPSGQQPTPVGRLCKVFTPYGDLDGTMARAAQACGTASGTTRRSPANKATSRAAPAPRRACHRRR
jgi:hypothetical protein